MRAINYLLLAVLLLGGCTSVFGQDETPNPTQEQVRENIRKAEQGYAHGQFSLGVMYYFAEGVPKDHVLSYKWFNLSAAQGNKNSAELRDVLATRMTPSQIQEAKKLAKAFKPRNEIGHRF